jgi:uncharacterized membrane protein
MAMDRFNEFLDAMFKAGTPQCGLFTGILAFIAGLLFIFIGFFRTILVVVIVAVGVFLGAVKNKKEAVRGVINRLFPPRDSKVSRNDKK